MNGTSRPMNRWMCAAALIAGAVTGYAWMRGSAVGEPPSALPPEAAAVAVTNGADGVERELSERIRALEATFQAKEKPAKSVADAEETFWKPVVRENGDGTATVAVRFTPPVFDLRKRAEELRQKMTPEEFKTWEEDRRKVSAEVAAGYDRRLELLLQIDDGWMSDEERKTFNGLIDRLKTLSDCTLRTSDWRLPLEDRKVMEGAIWSLVPNIADEYAKVRELLVGHMADVMGLAADERDAFVGKVREIERFTSNYTELSLPPGN